MDKLLVFRARTAHGRGAKPHATGGIHTVYYINGNDLRASGELARLLQKCIFEIRKPWSELVLLCIGSDRIPGDSLGPMIGYSLQKRGTVSVAVYGTLARPVHALNLADTLGTIKEKHPAALIVAVDASLGLRKHIGYITVGVGALYPGAGVKKRLPPVGDVFITGILNPSGAFEHLLLQTTRLSLVVRMADVIADGIAEAFPTGTP